MTLPHLPGARPATGVVASPFFATAEDRVAWARQRYFEEGQRPSGLVSEAVIQGWQRCLASGLKPQQRPDFEPIARSRTNAALARGRTLLDAAGPEIEQLDRMLAGTGCKVILVDGAGVVLRATAASAVARTPLELGARVGVSLAENNLGCTAPSVTARSTRACTVSGGEHFFGVLGQIHCAAAPIHNREGELAAVLDLSIEGRPFAFDAFGLVKLFAAAIENRYVAAQAHERLLVRFQVAPTMLGTPMEGLAVVDGAGQVAWINAAGSALLEPPGMPAARRDVEHLFGLTLMQLLGLCSASTPLPHRLPSGLGVWLLAVAPGSRRPGPAEDAPSMPAAPPSLDEVHRHHIEQTLAAAGGNISEAARRLGVSRGLLYRRLRAWREGHGSA